MRPHSTLYFKVLREVNEHVCEFVANCGDLVKLAAKYSATYNQLKDEDIFTFSYCQE